MVVVRVHRVFCLLAAFLMLAGGFCKKLMKDGYANQWQGPDFSFMNENGAFAGVETLDAHSKYKIRQTFGGRDPGDASRYCPTNDGTTE